jgi:hypothetical protein
MPALRPGWTRHAAPRLDWLGRQGKVPFVIVLLLDPFSCLVGLYQVPMAANLNRQSTPPSPSGAPLTTFGLSFIGRMSILLYLKRVVNVVFPPNMWERGDVRKAVGGGAKTV